MHLVGKRQGCGGDLDFYQLAIGPNAVPSDAVPLNTWTHLAVTYDGETSTQRQYVKGSLVLITGQTVGSNTAPLKIGNSGTCTPFGGLIDEVTIYNRTLSTSEIQGIYDAGSAGKCKAQPTPTPTPTPTPCSRIAFDSTRDGNYEIYVMNADGTGQTNLTNSPADDTIPNFSSDGSKIAFVSTRDGNSEIYVMNADGTGQTRLTNNPAFDDNPAFSPDGSKIAFESVRDGNYEVYVMNADGTNQTRLTSNSADDGDPFFSRDGSKIAFETKRDGDYWEIYLMNADGTGQTNLTNSPAHDTDPFFSPDGSKIAFETNRDGGYYEIYVMNADGTGQTNLTNNPAHDFSPSWSGCQAGPMPTPTPGPTCVPSSVGMVSWWPGDGNANDIQGNNNGTLQNGVAFAPGMVSQAFSFDGADDFVNVPDANSFHARCCLLHD